MFDKVLLAMVTCALSVLKANSEYYHRLIPDPWIFHIKIPLKSRRCSNMGIKLTVAYQTWIFNKSKRAV
ncbi:hypothetical protein J1614_008953 [Plenodomus biglobosus]|nr:hypothetical protein J1614_008953 [Plenodomus biglobosus]